MTSKLTRERLQEIAEDGFLKHGESKELARMVLAAMDSESECLPLDYLQGHKDGLELASQLAEANHPETGDWLYDDPIELAEAIRKGPDMPPAQPAADSEPVENHIGSKNALDAIVSFIKSKSNPTVKCYEGVSEQLFKDNCHGIHSHVIEYILKLGEELEDLRAEQAEMQPAPVVPDGYVMVPKEMTDEIGEAIAMQANCCGGIALDIYDAMIAAAPHDTPALNSLQSVDSVTGGWIPVSERMPEAEGHYLVWANASRIDGYCDHLAIATYQGGEWSNEFNWLVTHWMPLPATQEVHDEK
ncbi:DUF551 domain-containing protein [Escherichia coli]|nr:DUF551 domain-containing protein [Escherichia coli]EHD5457325.1 DUF551 domain-containing protein [Escherichia coli]EIX9173154.1 DUF551 domain-containing protein [Klebsiella pneumoniae]